VARRRRTQQQDNPKPSAIRDEVTQIARDERDREEMRVIREQLAELAPRRPIQTSSSV
jgi:hypothetical protein